MPQTARSLASACAVALSAGALTGWILFGGSAAATDGAPRGDGGSPMESGRDAVAADDLRARIDRLGEELAVKEALLKSARVRRAFAETERAHIERLYAAGYARLPRLLELQRAAATLRDREEAVFAAVEGLRRALAAATHALEAAPDGGPHAGTEDRRRAETAAAPGRDGA